MISSFLFHVPPAIMCCLATGPKATGLSDYRMKPLGLGAKMSLFPYQVDHLRYFVTVIEN
jgi:hypothetical protein